MVLNIFKKLPIPRKLPKSMQIEIDKLKKLKSQKAVLKKVWIIMGKRFVGGYWTNRKGFKRLWEMDPVEIWNNPGEYSCTHLNYILRILLIKSGQFTDEDIKYRNGSTFIISYHQHMEINLGDEKIKVDPWGYCHGIPLGKYACNFNFDPKMQKPDRN